MLWNAKHGSVPVGGTDMDYVSFGQGDRSFIVLPGLSDGLMTVKGKALLLAKPYVKFLKDYTVYMFSRKNKMPQGYSIREMAADQAAALKALGIAKASVMGVSQGGMIAQYLAVDYPELIEKLVIAVSAPRVNEMMRSILLERMEAAQKGDHQKLMIDTAETAYSEQYLKRLRAFYPILGRMGKPRTYDRFFINANAILGFDVYEELPKISCPTYIIGGAEDKTVGIAASYEMEGKIKHSELYIYQGLGHGAYDEAKDFYSRVYNFLIK